MYGQKKREKNMANRDKSTHKGGAHNTVGFQLKCDLCMSSSAIDEAFKFPCSCDDHCMWKCINNLPDAQDRVHNLRAPRFAGQRVHVLW